MSSQSIVQALTYVNWIVLMSLALGSLGLVYLLRQATDATRGYLSFTATCAGAIGVFVLLTDWALPEPTRLVIVPAPGLDTLRRVAIATFIVLAFVVSARLRRGGQVRWLGLAAVLAGVAVEVIAAFGWGGGGLAGVPLAIQLLMLAVVSGGALGAVILGHWYLVTPGISEGPLVLTTRLLTVALGMQLVLFLVWGAFGGAWGPAFSSFVGGEALLVWLRLIIGIGFPLVLSYMAWRTALTRSMESATGLLYIDLAAILASTIVAAALYTTTALLV